MRLLVCGMNGAGKSTLGRALAERMDLPFRDAEDYWFPKDGAYLYGRPRTQEEVDALLRRDVQALPGLVYAAVRCREEDVAACFDCAILVEAPRETRMRRIRERSYGKFGARMLPGGELHQAEERFFAQCARRADDDAERALAGTGLPILRVDGRRPVAENIAYLLEKLKAMNEMEQ